MKRALLITVLAMSAFAGPGHAATPVAPPDNTAGDSASVEIRKVLDGQQAAWNRGDLEGFMNGYARSDKTNFVSGDKVTRGWQTVLDGYRTKYSNRALMGTLAFSDLEITALGPDSAVVLGRWELKRAKDNPHGIFTLIFRRTADGWRIVQDHTSAAP